MPERSSQKSPTPARKDDGVRYSPWLVNTIGVVLTALWAISSIADIALVEYSTPWQTHAVFGGLVASVFGFQIVSMRNTNGER